MVGRQEEKVRRQGWEAGSGDRVRRQGGNTRRKGGRIGRQGERFRKQ
jgi:hypothetical protein